MMEINPQGIWDTYSFQRSRSWVTAVLEIQKVCYYPLNLKRQQLRNRFPQPANRCHVMAHTWLIRGPCQRLLYPHHSIAKFCYKNQDTWYDDTSRCNETFSVDQISPYSINSSQYYDDYQNNDNFAANGPYRYSGNQLYTHYVDCSQKA